MGVGVKAFKPKAVPKIFGAWAKGACCSIFFAGTLVLSNAQIPGSLVAKQSGPNGFVATWGIVSGASGYEVQVSTEPSFTSGLIGGDRPVSLGTTTSLGITGISAQIRYYRVRSVFPSLGEPVKTAWSPAVSAPDLSAFGKYATLNATGNADNFQAAVGSSANNNSYTISFWMRPDRLGGVSGSENVQVFRQPINSNASAANVDIDLLPDGSLVFGQRSEAGEEHFVSTPADTVLAGNWVHVTAVRDATNATLRLYINGVEIAAKTLAFGTNTWNIVNSGGPGANQAALNNDSNANKIRAAFDDVRIYRAVRTPVQILEGMSMPLNKIDANSTANTSLVFYAPLEGTSLSSTDANSFYKGTLNGSGSGTITSQAVLTEPILTWTPSPINLVAPAVLSTIELTASAEAPTGGSVAGLWSYSPAAGTSLSVGTNVVVGTFVPTDLNSYSIGTITNQIVVASSLFTYTNNGTGLTITGYTGTGGVVEIPTTIGGVAVTGIGDEAFKNITSITNMTLPNGVTAIGQKAFEGCTQLISISIPNSVATIGQFAFAGCSSLTSITLPTSLTLLDNYLFAGCGALSEIVIPNGVTTIGSNAFESCANLLSVTLPSSVTLIKSGAFFNCPKLAAITIPSAVATIEGNAFLNSSTLASVYFIGNTPPTIGVNAFSGIASGAVGYYPATASVAWGSVTVAGLTVTPFGQVNRAPVITGQSTTYDALAEFIAGPGPQSANSRWQYLGGNVSALALLGNWKTTGNEVIPNQSQWDGNSGHLNNYPFVQRVSTATGPVSANTLVIHPSNLEEANRAVAIGWKNISSQTVAANFNVNLRLPYGSANGIDYKLQRGLEGSSRYLSIRSGSLPAGGSVALASDSLLEMQAGEMLYLIVDSKNNFDYDHTEVSAFTVTVAGGANLISISEGSAPASNLGTAVTVLTATSSDDDSGALKGIAVTGVDTSHGFWEYTLNGGSVWNSLSGVNIASARLLKSDEFHRVRFVPNANFSGNAEIQYRAWDQTSGEDGALADLTAVGGGAWVLVAYGANASLGGFLTAPSGSFSSSARTGSAVMPGSLDILKNSMELAMTWTASGGSLPSGGIGSYTHGIAFALPNPAGMNFDGSASSPLIYNNGANPLNSSFAVGSSNPDQSLVNVRTLVGSPGMPSQMYLRNKTFGAGYGSVYGLVMNDGSNAQLDYNQVPDSQTFKAVYLDHGTGAAQGQGLVMGGSGGASNSYVPSTMALWARLDPLQVLALSGGNPISSSGNYLLGGVSTSYVDLIDFDATGAFSAQTATGTIRVLDTSAPVITLIGANPLQIYKGATFSDPGATVTDNVDTTRTITGSGTVNTATVGNYTLNYNTTDAAVNPAVQVTRTVNVVLDPSGDEDVDGVTNEVEIQVGTSPVDKPSFPETAFAVTFNGSSTQRVIDPRPVQDDFTLAFWIKTAQAGTGSTHWWEGRGLLDGEVDGSKNDFGTSLMAGGKIGFGVGNPDTTLKSTKSVNNSVWRHVVVTRKASSGLMNIYVDGVLDSSGTGPTGTKNAPSRLTLGSLQTNLNYFQGEMADFRIYDREISVADVWLLANRLSVSGSPAVATLLIDADSDGLDDAIDPDPTKPDTDGDGLTDGQEVNTFGSSPSLADTDGDGANDKLEVDLGKSPVVANVYNRLINGSFEDGTVKPSPGGNLPTHQDNVPGWKTTANNDFTIELWYSGFLGSSGNDGNTLAELNYIASGTLYQDVIMTVGTTVSYSFLHRGRSGTETIEFRIDRLVGGPGSAVEANFFNRQVSTGNGAWVRYRGTPAGTVQAGKTYRFSYSSITPDGGSGNLLDGASFEIDQDADGLTDSVETNTGTYASANNTGTDPLDFDSDDDGLNDGEEVITYGTNPVSEDTDGDGAPDGVEVTAGTNPKQNFSLPKPVITSQPVSITNTAGGSATFSVTATNPAGAPSGLTYQWKKSTNIISGQTNQTLNLAPLTVLQSGSYSVVVANIYGSTNSTVATLTVTKATPTITLIPTATPIAYGQTLAFSTLSGGVASVPGSFAWTAPSTLPSAGTVSQGVTFNPTDTANYNTVTASVNVTVNQALISSGFSHTLYLGAGASTVTAWGMNTDGRLGVGDMNSPVNWAKAVQGIPLGYTVTGLAAGGTHSLILANGKVYAAGSDRFGQLGQGAVNGANKASFTPVVMTSDIPAAVAAGGNHSLIVTTSGKVFACGDNTYGQLAQPATTSSSGTFVEVNFPGLSTKIVSVAAGADHNLAVDENGGVWVWGRNNYGQLGKGNRSVAERNPSKLNLGDGVFAESVAAGFSHSLILTTDGEVLGFGRNNSGQTGQVTTTSVVTAPSPIYKGLIELSEIRSIAAGTDSSFAITESGQLYSWGYNTYGELLLGHASPAVYEPAPSPICTNVSNVSGGGYSSLAVGAQGVIFGGRNDVGQSGNGPDPEQVLGDYIYLVEEDLELTNLTMDLAGTTETLYDQIFVGSGTATLNGILNLMFVGTYSGPVYGSTQTFDLIWAKNGINLVPGYELAFNQAGYLVESTVADKIVGGVSGKVLQATVRAVESDLDSDKADALALAQASLDGLENGSYRVESNETIGVSQLSASPSRVVNRVEMIYSYTRPTGGVMSGAEYFFDGSTYRVEYTASLDSELVDWNPAVVTGTTITPLGGGYERATLRISSSGGAGFLRLQVENPQANGINAGVGSAITY
jgi:alpha-tubulin suppressor-like RCC1 family protein